MSELLTEPDMTVAEVARLLGVRPAWVYAAVESPESTLPHFRLGRYLRFRRSEISEWMYRRHSDGPRKAVA